MNDTDILTLLSNKHIDWIKMARAIGGKSYDSLTEAEELVSDMYIRLHKYIENPDKIMYNDTEVNTMFVYVTLRNLYYNKLKEKKKSSNIEYTDNIIEYDTTTQDNLDISGELSKMWFEDKLTDEINTWHYYDARVFRIIFFEGISMRQLAKESGISLSSIFNTVKQCKIKLKDKFGKDYEELKKKQLTK